ncbi:hypothetical protein SDC9_141381 [bioreactor metagenome]|uniref:Uncharacterized protein n=1 Tax=bioreactor metagenome TaxID=1076179 RepID=A0A645DY18_9ZZZZ
MRDKGAGGGTTGDTLQNGSIHFQVAKFVDELAHGIKNTGALDENILYFIVYHQIHITLTVTKFGVIEFIVGNAIFHFYYGKRLQRFGKHGK